MMGDHLTTREALERRICSEVAGLEGEQRAWWDAHRVEPSLVPGRGRTPYAVAIGGGGTLLYFGDLDAFGEYAPETEDGPILHPDLAAAVRSLAARDSVGRVLADTAERLLRLGGLERGDEGTRRRVLRVLAAIGPGAAVAVPRLIEIATREEPAGDLQEQAVATLAAIGPGAAEAVPTLIRMAELDAANARGWCLEAFRAIGPAAAPAVPLLIDLLLMRARVDPDPFYVSLAAGALGEIGSIEALPALVPSLRETADPEAATAVALALGKLGPAAAEAIPTLAALAGGDAGPDRFPGAADVIEAAREALDRIGRP